MIKMKTMKTRGYIDIRRIGKNTSRALTAQTSSYKRHKGVIIESWRGNLTVRPPSVKARVEWHTYRVARIQVDGEPESVGEHEKGEGDKEDAAHLGSLVKGSVEKDAASSEGLGLLADSLQAEDKQTVSVVHFWEVSGRNLC